MSALLDMLEQSRRLARALGADEPFARALGRRLRREDRANAIVRKALLRLVALVAAAERDDAGAAEARGAGGRVPFVERGELLPVVRSLAADSEPQVLVREMARDLLEQWSG